MIDIVREIDAVQREVGSGRLAAGEARTIRLRRTYDAPIDDVWDALTNPERISRWFLPDQRRLPGRRQLPVRGQRRGPDRRLRTAEPAVRHVGLRRDGRRGHVRARAAAHARRRRGDGLRARAHGDRARRRLGAVRTRRRRRGLGPGPARAGAASARRLGRAIRRRGSCPRRGARSRPGAARRGAPRARPPAPMRRPSPATSRARTGSTRRSRTRRPEALVPEQVLHLVGDEARRAPRVEPVRE